MNIVFLFYEGMTPLDAIGPYEVLSRLPGVTVNCAALQPGIVRTGSKLGLEADSALSDISFADVLCIPGGGKASSLSQYPEVLEWVKKIHSTTTWTTSVCTGSLILGAAGILTDLPATTHWAVMDRLKNWGAIPTQARVVETGKIITAAGVSAGIDMALILAEKISGRFVAESLQLGLEYDPQPPFDSGSPTKAESRVFEAVRAHLMDVFEK